MFRDRVDAGQQLALRLIEYQYSPQTVVLALPRGGVIIGHEIAERLSLALEILVVRKIGHSHNPEYAIGAIDENGTVIMNGLDPLDIDEYWLKEKIQTESGEAKRQGDLYRQDKPSVSLDSKTIVIVDDGIVTGLSMRVAVRFAKVGQAKKIIVAVPVASPESVRAVFEEGADEIVVLRKPEEFKGTVSLHYRYFGQAGDKEVFRLLQVPTTKGV